MISTFGIWDLFKLSQMIPPDEFWRSVAFFLIGGIIGAALVLKLLHEAEASEEKCRRPRPQEHDERDG